MRARPVLAALAVLVVSCGVPEEGFEAIAPEDLPAGLRAGPPEAPTTTSPSAPWIAEVFWVRGETLVPVAVTLGGPVGPGPLLEVLAAGPSESDVTAGLRTAFQDATLVRSTDRRGATMVVDLDPRFTTDIGADQVRALGQLVFSLTSLPGVDRVRLTVDGQPVAVPTPSGDVVDRAVGRDDYAGLIDLGLLGRPAAGG